MELLRGETLKEALRHETLSVTEVVTFSKQMASALAAAHAQGIVHRDIKPANIFVVGAEGRRQIKILDFGLAKQQGVGDLAESGDATATFGGQATSVGTMTNFNPELTSPGSTLGTVAYMSPEQAEGQGLDARTDLFSLGSVMFEMATGRTPFAGTSAARIFASLLKDEVPAVSTVRAAEGRPPMPAGFDEIVAQLLVKDRAQRYQRATDVERDLEDLTGSSGSGVRAAASGTFAAQSGVHAAAEKTSGAKGKLIAAGLIVLLLAGGGFAWWKHAGTRAGSGAVANGAAGVATPGAEGQPAAVKDSIILADFVNQAGDPVFDTTLNQALRIDLEQSPVIKIVSEDHLRQSVKYLGKPDDTVVTPAIAREIGEREGMKAILTGTIAKVGNEYLVTLTAQNTATGDEIASEQATAVDKDHVLDALGKTAAGMRAKLGEDLASIKKLNTPFGQATTPSLEAFRAYALGDEAHGKGLNIPEAEGHYKRALELDPNFAMANARLGVVYGNAGEVAKAIPYFAKAFEQSKHVSEAERLYIAGHYYNSVTGDMPKMIETLQESIQTYPGQLAAYVNINVAYQSSGQFEKGLPYAQKAVQLQPDNSIASLNLMSDLIALGRMDEARQEMEREGKLGMDSGTALLSAQLGGYYFLGDAAQVQRIVAQATGRPDTFVVTQILGAAQQYSGKFREAARTFDQAYEQAGREKAPDVQAGILLENALGRAMAGLCDGNEAVVKQALALDKSKQTLEYAALTATVCGGGKVGMPIAEELSKKYPQDTKVQDVYLPLSKAYVALTAGQAQQAIADAEPSKPYDALFPGSYVQGLAYLELHDAGSAVQAFKSATQCKACSVPTSYGTTFYAPAQLGLARAYAMAGDKVNAKKTYEAFLLTWKDADADLPMLVAAKKEYAAL